MNSKYILLLAFIVTQFSFAQNSPVYYDKNWKETTKENSSFYRPLPLKEVGELVLIRDFFNDGTLQFEGYVLKEDENAYVGEIQWYDKNGLDDSYSQYYNDTKNPLLTYYHQNGKIRKTVEYKKGVKNGETIIYAEGGTVLMKGIYAEGKPSSGYFETVNSDYEQNSNSEERGMQKTVSLSPQIGPSTNSPKTVNRKTITQQIYWDQSKNLAQEKIYALEKYDLDLIEQRNYDLSGKLIQTIKEKDLGEYSGPISNGIFYEYFLKNNLAKGIKTTTAIHEGQKNGKSISFYPNGKKYSETNYSNGSKEGEELIYSENGSLKYKRIYKEDEPFTGNFDVLMGDLIINVNYINGEKEGSAVTKNEQNEIITTGTYKKGKPFNGTFIVEKEGNNDESELINVENFKKTGLQKTFIYRLENPEKTYTIKGEKLNGPTTFYEDGIVIATLEYRDDLPFNGTLIEDETTTEYKNGKMVSEIFYQDQYSRNENQIKRKKEYEDGVPVKVYDHSFTIAEDLKDVYLGILKNGKPYSGYFQTEDDREFKEVNFFEAGVPKFQYSNNYLENMDNYRHQTFDIKSIYKDGKIYTGIDYSLSDRQYVSRYLKDGVLQSFDWDLFAMHYFNRIHFEIKKNTITISDLQKKQNAVIKIDFSGKDLKKKLIIDGREVETITDNFSEMKSGEKLILYYLVDNKVISKTVDPETEAIEPNEGTDLFHKVYQSISYESTSIQDVFNKLSEKIGAANFLEGQEESEIITGLRTNSAGKPNDGILITILPDNIYNLQLYSDSQLIKTSKNISAANLKTEIAKLDSDL